jgi:hypothetical protein
MQLTSRIFEAEDMEAAVAYCYEQKWTDGLPVIPPTPRAVGRIIEYLKREPAEIVGVIPPRNGVATIEKIAINSVMAGCKPEFVPIVIAAIEAMLAERFNLNGVQTTTHCCAPLCIVSGPAVKSLQFNTREGTFGHGCHASASIGRAIRLILWNIGGGYPGEPCKTTFGHPGYYSFCIAEDQDANRWEPLHVERGFAAEDTVVTVSGVTAPQSVVTAAGYGRTEDVLYLLADSITMLGSNNITGGDVVMVLGPMAAKHLADAGMSKLQFKQQIMQLAKRPVREVKRRKTIAESSPYHWNKLVDVNDDEALVPYIRKPENLIVVTSGGWGSGAGFCCVCAGWGSLGGITSSARVQFPVN